MQFIAFVVRDSSRSTVTPNFITRTYSPEVSPQNVVRYADFAVAKECLPHMELLKPVFSQSTSSFSFVITGVAYEPLAHPQPLKMDGGRANLKFAVHFQRNYPCKHTCTTTHENLPAPFALWARGWG